MTTQKVIVLVGTRPDAIKMAPVIRALKNDTRYECLVCSTGQHKEMLQQVFDWFDITPDFRLDVMTHNQPLAHLAGRIMNGLHDIIKNVNPDSIMVHGDTTTGFVGALTAHYCYDSHNKKPVKIAHIEAGLRTGNIYAPFPEESNRRLIAPLADWNFAPTLTAAEALFEENITGNIHITGNTVIDALFDTVDLLKHNPHNPLPQIAKDEKFILVTGHRRESYGEGFNNICLALKDLAHKYPDTHIVYPVHLNPFVKEPVTEMLGGIENIHLVRPMDYPNFVSAMQRCHFVLTDSGGLQEEAPALGKPVLVMRDLTERPDAIIAGTAKMVGTTTKRIITNVSELLDNSATYTKMANAVNPYGDGLASERIINIMAGESAQNNTFEVVAA